MCKSYVYAIGPASTDNLIYDTSSEERYYPFKIGVSSNPQKRLKGIQTGCFVKLEILACIETTGSEEAYVLEKELHEALNTHNSIGEWFKINQSNAPSIVLVLRRLVTTTFSDEFILKITPRFRRLEYHSPKTEMLLEFRNEARKFISSESLEKDTTTQTKAKKKAAKRNLTYQEFWSLVDSNKYVLTTPKERLHILMSELDIKSLVDL